MLEVVSKKEKKGLKVREINLVSEQVKYKVYEQDEE